MKILLHHRIASRDGQAVHLEELAEALSAQGHQTLLVGPPGLQSASFGGSSSVVDSVKRLLPGAVYELLEIVYNVTAFFRLRASVRAFQPDIIYERFSLFLLAGSWMRRLSGLPVLLEVNSPLYEERLQNDGLKLHALGRWFQRRLWRGADFVLPVTHVLARTVRDYGVPAERIAVIPNGINPARFRTAVATSAAKESLGLPAGLTLGFIGFIRSWNAVHRVVDFLAAHGERYNLHFLVVGDGPARESLLVHAASLGVSHRLTITGVVGRDDVAAHIAAMDIALLPGLTEYSSPLKLFEYMYLGRAVVAPDTANIREILTDRQDGLLFDVKSQGAMENALLELCDDASLRSRIGARARTTIDEKALTWSRNAERVVALAQSAMRHRNIR